MNIVEVLSIITKPKKSGYKIIKEEKLKPIPMNYKDKFKDFLGDSNYLSPNKELLRVMDKSWYLCDDCNIRKQPVFDFAITEDMSKCVMVLICYNCYQSTFLYLEK